MRNKFFRLFMVLIVATAMMVIPGCTQSNQAALGDLTVTSTNVGNHTHDIIILRSAIQNPPAGQVIYTTTSAGTPAHTHTVTLTQQNLTDIKNQAPVTVTSSTVNGHSHDFLILGTGQSSGSGSGSTK